MTALEDPWNADPRDLGEIVSKSIRELTNCWVRETVPTREQSNTTLDAMTALGYLVTRARRSAEHLEGGGSPFPKPKMEELR